MKRNLRFYFVVIFVLILLFSFASCSEISTQHSEMTTTTTTIATTTAVTTATTVTTTAVTTVTTAEPIDTQYERIQIKDYSSTLEAEDFEASNGAYVAMDKGDYSGEGYIDGFSFSTESGVVISLEVPYTQYYDLSFFMLSDSEEIAKANIVIGDTEHTLEILQSDLFTEYCIENILISSGNIDIVITGGYNDFCLDRIEIVNNSQYKDLYFELNRELCNEDSSNRTNALYQFLCDNFMQKTISGQFASNDENKELELIYQATGYYPLIRMGDLGCYSLNGGDMSSNEIAASLEWAEKGGVVSLMWHWLAPMGTSTVYAAESDFDLATAIEDINNYDLAHIDSDELTEALEEESISPEAFAIISDIDNIAANLAVLKDADIPVIWRPLHEAGNNVFWWGNFGGDAYRALWALLYERLTEYHELNNLIWIWNGQSEAFLVPENMYDIASVDIYTSEPDRTSQYRVFALLHDLTQGKKMLAISECSTIPDIAAMLTDGAVWSYFGLWYGEYIADEFGRPYSEFNNTGYLTSIYSSVYTLTLKDGKNIYTETENE